MSEQKKNLYIEDIAASLGQYVGQQVRLRGWLYNKRSSGRLHFLQLRDGTGVLQCVMSKADVGDACFDEAKKLNQESSFCVSGTVQEDKRSPIGFELHISDLEIYSLAEEYPISPKEHGVAFLMDHRHLWLRSKRQNCIMRIRSTLIKAIRDYFDNEGFTLLDAPIFTPNACEGTSTLFETKYFDDQAYLTQSGQLYMEAGAMALGKVYCFGPTFRAEKSKTRRHLTEFWMVEPEVAFFDLNDDMDLMEDMMVYLVEKVLEKHEDDLKTLERDVAPLKNVKKPFPRLSYSDAVNMLKEKGVNVEWGNDFGGDDETVLSNMFDRPFMVHHYPSACKAFYMKHDQDDEKLSLSVDMLAPEGRGEIIGGGQREEDLDMLKKRLKEHELPEEAFKWYFDLRRYGSVPHAGFGLGVERALAWICGLHHVRETIPFPRLMDRLSP